VKVVWCSGRVRDAATCSLIDPAPRLEDDRGERPFAQLRDPQLDIMAWEANNRRLAPLRSVTRVSVRS
jgi:hypothetical protein